MKITDYLKKEDVYYFKSCKSKLDLYKDIIPSHIVTNKGEKVSKSTIMKIIDQREKAYSVIIRDDVALPHARIEDIDSPIIKFSYVEEGVEFEKGKICHFIIVFITPLNKSQTHLQVMAKALTLFKKEEIIHRIKMSNSVDEVYEILRQEEIMAICNYSSLSIEQAFADFETSANGLTYENAQKRLEKYGKNDLLPRKQSQSFFKSLFGKKEERNDKIVTEFQALIPSKVKVIRDRIQIEVFGTEIVPGDIIVLSEGDIIPADARLIETYRLKVNNKILTGESIEIYKGAEAIKSDTPLLWEEFPDMIFAGTRVTEGRGKAVVIGTGLNTQLGVILSIIEQSKTSANSNNPIIIKDTAKNLKSVDTICMEKTGVLTLDQMKVESLFINHKLYNITGEGYNPVGDFINEKNEVMDKNDILNDDAFKRFFETSILCGKATLSCDTSLNCDVSGDVKGASLLVLAKKMGLDYEAMRAKSKRLVYNPFESIIKRMSVTYQNDEGNTDVYVKGSPLEVMERCETILLDGKEVEFTVDLRQKVKDTIELYTEQGLRILAFACRKNVLTELKTKEDAENHLTYIALAGINDAPKKGIKESINKAKEKGIKIILMSLDYPNSVKAFAKNIGLVSSIDELSIITGSEISSIDDKKLIELITEAKYLAFSRVESVHKTRVISCLKSLGHTVATAGLCLNDTLAMKISDIGVTFAKPLHPSVTEIANVIIREGDFETLIDEIIK